MSTWPDGTPKSTGNAFDLRSKGVSVANCYEFKQSVNAKKSRATVPGKPITLYSRAKKSK